ncbi:glycosyltransferase family 39 protein [Deltaproteobacteria bacterium TL4]
MKTIKLQFHQHYGAFIILFLHFVVFFIVNQWINPHPDMLDHWVWSRYLSLSYYEHPPMVALLFRLITTLLGHSERALELGAQFSNLSILGLAYFISLRLWGKSAALVTLVLLCSTAYFTLGSVFLHIDQPFLVFWLLNLYALCRFHQSHDKKWLWYIGIFAGLGALSKYITLLFYLGMGLHFLCYQELRRQFLNPWLYVAGWISLLIFSPVLLWNFNHDWVSFRFQFGRGLSGAAFGENALLFTLGHLALFSPVWSWWCFFNLWQQRVDFKMAQSPESIILVVSLFPLAFFTLMSFRGSIADPHWANVAYLGMMLLAGKSLATMWRKKRFQAMLVLGILLNFVILGVIVAHIHRPLFDLMQYQVLNYDYLKQKGVPLEVQEKLKSMKQRYYGTQPFLEALKKVLLPQDYARYQQLIVEASMRTLSDPANPMLAWDKTSVQLQELFKNQGMGLPDFIISKEFQLSSALSYYLPQHPWPHSLEKQERNQWSPVEQVSKGKSVFVCDLPKCQQALRLYAKVFPRNDLDYLGAIITQSHNRVVRTLGVYVLTDPKSQKRDF